MQSLGAKNIAVVGPCASGKTTLVEALRQAGVNARQIGQEHSYVPAMWQKINRPDLLIFLNASFETCSQRKNLNWAPADHAEQMHRLRHAREHCDIMIETDDKNEKEVLQNALQALGVGHSDSSRV